MNQKIKKTLYFPVAYYFFFFAKIKLFFWKPKIICITGSSGKTTQLHLLESQLPNAHFSHNANSAFGVPFDILGIKRKTFSIFEWPKIIFLAPFNLFTTHHKDKFFVVEADCDRPGEGKFLANLLNPAITLWLSSDLTHVKNFDDYDREKFTSHRDAIAYEFGYLLEKTKEIAFVNSDSEFIKKQFKRAKCHIQRVTFENLMEYKVFKDSVEFITSNHIFNIPHLVPKDVFYSIQMTSQLLDYLNIPVDKEFKKLKLPPGRSSLFDGIKNIKIIDSSYNSSFLSLKSMINLLVAYPNDKKWIVIGDILELGEKEEEEHKKIAEVLNNLDLDKIILVGPRTQDFTLPNLENKKNTTAFLQPIEALNYIKEEIEGGEVILLKGARFLEGIIEHLLKNKDDIKKLCRREPVWQKRREEWGL